MHDIQRLPPELYEKWDEFILRSPQAGLFQTTGWAEMLCETDEQDVGYFPLVCMDGNDILGGIIIRYRVSSGKKIADLPPFFYGGPAFSPKFYNPERRHTFKTYTIFSDLLKVLEEQFEQVVLENQPEIWDARAYKYQSWRVGVGYTHIWRKPDSADLWNGICPEMQELLQAANVSFDFKVTGDEKNIAKFEELFSRTHKEIPTRVLRRRIEWLLSRDRARLFMASDQSGEIAGLALVILSNENQTAYVWDSVSCKIERENLVIPYLYYQSYLALGSQFGSMDLGKSGRHLLSEMKDKLGCELTPLFITKYQRSK